MRRAHRCRERVHASAHRLLSGATHRAAQWMAHHQTARGAQVQESAVHERVHYDVGGNQEPSRHAQEGKEPCIQPGDARGGQAHSQFDLRSHADARARDDRRAAHGGAAHRETERRCGACTRAHRATARRRCVACDVAQGVETRKRAAAVHRSLLLVPEQGGALQRRDTCGGGRRGATWLGGDTDAVTLALPHGVEFPLELQGSAFGLFTRDYAEQLLTAWSNPFLKGYAFNITHDHAAYLPAAIKELRTVVLAWPAVHTANERQLLDALDSASRLDSSSLSRDVLQQRDVRHALVATLHEDKGAVLTNALLDLIGPEVMKMKGARVSDNLGALSYERYAALASGEVQQLTVVKSQLLKLGWCGQRSMAFTHAPIHVRGQNDKRKVLALESPFVELPPGQLPRAGIKRRLTVPWGYDPLPRTVAQVQLCIDAAHELSAVAACVGEALDWSTLKAEQLDQLKVVWARVRSEGGSASVASTRTGVHCGGCAPFGFDVKRRRTCTHAQRDTQWTTLAGGATPCTRRASDGTVDTSATLVEALHSLPIPLRSEEQHKTLSPVNKMAPRKSVVPSKCTAEFIMFMVRSAVTDSKSVPLEPARSSFERQLRRGIRKRTGSKRSTLQKGARLEALCRQLFPDALLSRS